MIYLSVYSYCKPEKKLPFLRLDVFSLFLLSVDIPVVLQGRDFSDELWGGKRGEEQVNICKTSQKHHNGIDK